ncbi:MAG: hypothetical protein J0L73_23530 [Verrucomicrobia bacterium]|nr:hypothetical protein [Verrucomicrobiota bacterium]
MSDPIDNINPINWLWDKIKSYFWAILVVPLLPFLGLVPAVLVVVALVLTTGTQIDAMTSSINDLAAHIHGTPATVALSQANRIIPLAEGMAMIVSVLGLRAVSIFVRFIISWIPGR